MISLLYLLRLFSLGFNLPALPCSHITNKKLSSVRMGYVDSLQDSFSFHNMKLMKILSPMLCSFALSITPIHAADNIPSPVEPSVKDVQTVQIAFKDFDARRFDDADKEFSTAILRWKELYRPRDEIVSLLKARASVRLDNKQFSNSISDYNSALELMRDGEKEDGTGKYPEYVDTFVGRALAYEGLGDWNRALKDYNKAVSLWGGGRGEGVNPFVLTFRGNTLSRLDRVQEAIMDYQAAADRFLALQDIDRYSDAKANLALALYQEGEREESIKAMKDVIRRNPGYADMHVALAADSWRQGEYLTAINEWSFTCDKISVGCDRYRDDDWLLTVRRWPPSLIDNLKLFRNREIPSQLKLRERER